LLTAFRQIVFERGYENAAVRDIAARADVGRSTFYEHYTGKEDILGASMSKFLAVFANSVERDTPPDDLVPVLEHLWSNRRLTDAIFSGTSRNVLGRALAQHIDIRLRKLAVGEFDFPLRLASIQVAEGQLALVEAWLRRKSACAAARLASALHASSRASAQALLFGLPPSRSRGESSRRGAGPPDSTIQ
jgi:AcrR family transcriptional regulator